MAEDTNRIVTPLRQEEFDLIPEFQRRVFLQSGVAWTFSILFGRCGSLLVPIQGSAAGVLSVADANVAGTALTSIAVDAAKGDTRDLIAAPGANKQLWIHGGILTGSAEGTAKLIDSTPADLSGEFHVAANGGFTMPVNQRDNQPWFKCATNTKLQVVLSANTDLDGVLLYRTVDV